MDKTDKDTPQYKHYKGPAKTVPLRPASPARGKPSTDKKPNADPTSDKR